MALLRNHQMEPKDSATTPLSSLTLPRWATAGQGPELRLVGEPGRATWTCAKCGTVVDGVSAAARHIELHRPQERLADGQHRCVPSQARARRHSVTLVRKRRLRNSSGSRQ